MDEMQRDPEVVRTYRLLEDAISEHIKALSATADEHGVIVTEWVMCTANVSQETMRRDADNAGIEPPTTGYSYLGSRTAYHSRMGLAQELLNDFTSDKGDDKDGD